MDVSANDGGPVVISSNVSSAGDDADSWTILDEDEEAELQNQREEDESQPLIGLAKVEEIDSALPHVSLPHDHETDSDIETLEERHHDFNSHSTVDDCLDSLPSDGIPVGDDLSDERQQYIWSKETEVDDASLEKKSKNFPDLTSQYPTEELPDHFSEIQKGHTYVHNRNQNLNMLLSAVLVVFIAATLGLGIGNFLGWSSRIEIHEQFAEVQDEKLEELTDSLVSCMTGAEGQGGDDQDLDDRVIQQLSEENRRLKEELGFIKQGKETGVAEELTVILHDRINDLLLAKADLEREVARLRYGQVPIVVEKIPELHLEQTMSDLQQTKASLNEIAAENELLKIAIGKARYGLPPSTLDEEKEKIEQLQMENEELKIEVQKIRQSISHLVSSMPDDTSDKAGSEIGLPKLHSEIQGDIVASPEVEVAEPAVAQPVVTIEVEAKTDLHQVFITTDQVIDGTHDSSSDPIRRDIFEQDDEGYLSEDNDLFDNEIDNQEQTVDVFSDEELFEKEFESNQDLNTNEVHNEELYANKYSNEESESSEDAFDDDDALRVFFEEASKSFKALQDKLKNIEWQDNYLEELRNALDNLKAAGSPYFEQVFPQEATDTMTKLSKMLQDKGQKIKDYFDASFNKNAPTSAAHKWFGKFTKTLKSSLKSLGNILKDDVSDKNKWEKRVQNLREKMEKKWSGLKQRFHNFFIEDGPKQHESEQGQGMMKREESIERKKGEDGNDESRKKNKKTEAKVLNESQPRKPVKSDKNETESKSRWIFERAQKREQSRKEQKRSDWFFERAHGRKMLHDLTGSEWNTRRAHTKHCAKNQKGEMVCTDLEAVNVASVNHGKSARGDTLSFDTKKSEFVKPDKNSFSSTFDRHTTIRRSDILPTEFDDGDDSDDDDIDEDDDFAESKVNKRKSKQEWSFRDDFFAGNGAGRILPKKPPGGREDPNLRDSQKMEKRSRFQNHNSEKHHRKNKNVHIVDNFDFFDKFN